VTENSPTPPTVGEVLGRTARELRGDRKVELVARAAKLAGLNWGTGRIADLEAGRVSPTLPTLFALCWAFGDLLDRPVRLAELFAGDGRVTLSPGVTIELAELRAALGGQPIGTEPVTPGIAALRDKGIGIGIDTDVLGRRANIREQRREELAADPLGLPLGFGIPPKPFASGTPYPERFKHVKMREVRAVERSLLEADYRLAHSLDLNFARAALEMAALWGRSFTAERDHRAGADANAQKRGRISRELKAELQEAINRGDD